MEKKCTTLIYLQRFNKILVTLYIVHMGFKSFSFLFILYTDLYLCVFAGNLCFLFIGGVSFCYFFLPFIDFYLWRVILKKKKHFKKMSVFIFKSLTERRRLCLPLFSWKQWCEGKTTFQREQKAKDVLNNIPSYSLIWNHICASILSTHWSILNREKDFLQAIIIITQRII